VGRITAKAAPGEWSWPVYFRPKCGLAGRVPQITLAWGGAGGAVESRRWRDGAGDVSLTPEAGCVPHSLRCGFAGTRPGGRDTFLLHDKKVSKEACPASPALRAEGSPESRPFAWRKAKQLALRNPALTPRCERPAGPVAKLAGPNAAVVGQRDRTTPGEPFSLGGSEGEEIRATS